MLEGELENGGDFGQIGHDGLLHSMGVATKECSRAILIRCTVPYWEFLVVLRRMLFGGDEKRRGGKENDSASR
jgi:hypothetical protein